MVAVALCIAVVVVRVTSPASAPRVGVIPKETMIVSAASFTVSL